MSFSLKERILPLADPKRAAFNARLAPSLDPHRFLGVCTPDLKRIAKSLTPEEKDEFLHSLPHDYIDEDFIHIHLLNTYTDPAKVRQAILAFLPSIDSWCQTDSLTFPKIKTDALLALALEMLERPESYGRRLGILWIMKRACKLDDDLAKAYLQKALACPGEQREIQLAKAWMLCEFMIYKPDLAWAALQDANLEDQIIRTAIQKCLDSRRISDLQKQDLRSLRRSLSTQ